ncbi:DNA-binding SARP family transcriptional activator [Murinocardiopsis flavida]|uniref:DNA-binding SARP family transcriptional activator n=1 Tax=Murinocardiopsis flavida TaxID=645275 RepID=A0A2P8CZ57_9ACTN|nr:BTAD domain-containing putative transcriptional regulator [Murinocardiopsis flavida]PSK90240.1 DNA-binding SARP family transcriptional activator [Murinocardiopsis flavida]
MGPVRQQAVLAALVLRSDVTVSQEQLLDRVWGQDPPSTGVRNMPGYVFRLRRCLQANGVDAKSVIVSDRSGYRFVGSGALLDTVRLNELAAEAGGARQSGDLAAAVGAYTRALALFDGEPLAGLPGPFAEGERRRLAERRVALLQDKLDAQVRLGRYDEVVDELPEWIEAYPHAEGLAALLVRARYGGGQQADALRVFPRLRDRLVEDLGVEPGAEMQSVHQAVLRGDDASLGLADRSQAAGAPPAPVPADRPRDELPVGIGELIGRERELALLAAPIAADAVTTAAVDGVAGAGKTALAVNAARTLRADCPDGCLFVDLHGHSGRRAPAVERVLRRLLRAVGVDDSGTPDDLDELAASWRAATASLRLVLVLDDAWSAEQVRPLLPAGAGSSVLVTSRRRLAGLDAERRVSLEPLHIEAAAALLNRIAGASRAGGEPGAVRALARLCGRLPLALCIAGARLQTRPAWTFEDLVARLADDEGRLGGLTAGDRSVEAAFRASYDQLPDADQRAFRVLGLSPTPELDRLTMAAMLDCPPRDADRSLERLVDASLVQQPAADRYRLHDLVAVFARRLAAEEPAEAGAMVTARVFRLYIAAGRIASEWGAASFPTGPEPGDAPFRGWEDASAWLDKAGDFADVVGHAAAIGQVGHACWIAEAVVDFLVRRGRIHESRAAVEIALSRVGDAADPRMAPSLYFCLGFAYGMQGRYDQARTWFSAALEGGRSAGDRRVEARARGGLVISGAASGRHGGVLDDLAAVIELAEELGDDWLVERATSGRGYILLLQGRPEEALDCFTRSRALGEAIGSPSMVGRALCSVGSILLQLGRPAEAAPALRQAVDLADQVADVTLRVGSLTRLAAAMQELGEPHTAIALFHQALAVISDQTAVRLELELRDRLGTCYLAMGRRADAQEQFEALRSLGAMTAADDDRIQRIPLTGKCVAAE